jgi:transmembrane sensor
MIDKPDSQVTRLGPLDQEAYDWVVRFVAGDAQPADVAALKQWAARSPAHKAAFDRASLMWKATGPAGREVSAGASSVPHASTSGITRRAMFGGALAASAAGVVCMATRPPLDLWPSVSELASDYRTETGIQRKLTLSESVAVELNSRTSINVHATNGAADQIELVSGEAAVALAPNAAGSFELRARGGQTIAGADARFNVRCDEQTVSVTCVAGSVRVDHGAANVLLPAGQQVRYTTRDFDMPEKADLAVVTAWQDGVVIFQSTPVAEVVAEINRYRPGRVLLTNEALGRRIFNARVPIRNVDRVIGQIAEIFGVRVTALPGGIVLLG